MILQSQIRNFAIIAHVDHGKSTLSDRLLEVTKTISKDKMQEQFLDQNPISRERGITIKLAPVRMNFLFHDTSYSLNLIDTPGHVDFSYEVSRTLAACEGAVLLVDATQGIQAQTVAHYQVAKKLGLVMIPVINKIDLPNAQTDIVTKELSQSFGFLPEDIFYISAKTGENVEKLLEAIVAKIPPPSGTKDAPLRALIFDAVYDEYRGVVAYVKVVDGEVKKGDKITFFANPMKADVTEVGFFSPYLQQSDVLTTGEIGYILAGVKDIRQARVGDTMTVETGQWKMSEGKLRSSTGGMIEPLPGYTTPQPMVFFGMYPKSSDDFGPLKESLGKLMLNDTALTYSEEYSAYLGSGFRVGFLGLLHAEIVKERLAQEFGLEILLTMPQVLYERREDGSIFEPYMLLSVYVPTEYVGGVMTLCQKRKGTMIDMQYHEGYAVLTYEMPYSMFIRGLSNDIKATSSGFASIDYEVTEYKPADLLELEIKINDNTIDVLSELVYKGESLFVAREKAAKLKDALPRQQVRQIIQAVINGAIVAREEIPPYRKDVLAKMSGGDRTRKDKLLEAQRKGKSRMTSHAKIDLPQEALFSLIEKN
jgi:GTP-binding protein LepA